MGSSRTPRLSFAPYCILRCCVLYCACCRICVLEFAIAAAKFRRYAFAAPSTAQLCGGRQMEWTQRTRERGEAAQREERGGRLEGVWECQEFAPGIAADIRLRSSHTWPPVWRLWPATAIAVIALRWGLTALVNHISVHYPAL